MFEFLKEAVTDTYCRMNGIEITEDTKRVKTKKKNGEYIIIEEEEVIIMKKKTKITFFVIGIVMLIFNAGAIYLFVKEGNNAKSIIKYSIETALIIPTLILLCFKSKKSEIISIILMGLIALIYLVAI